MKKIKSIILKINLIVITLVICGSIAVDLATKLKPVKADDDKILEIVACNLSFQDSVKIMYAVNSKNILYKSNIEVLIWHSPQTNYLVGEEDYSLSLLRFEEIAGTEYAVFLDPNVAAKQMADDFYAVPYYNDHGEDVYGEVVKYSIIQYVKNMKSADASSKLLDLLDAMVEYGALTQEYFNYNTSRLANEEYHEVILKNELFSDGTNHGLFKENEEITITSSLEDFRHWVEDDINIGDEKTLVYKVTKDTVIESTNKDLPNIGLEFDYYDDGDNVGYLVGIGTCTDKIIIVPETYNDLPVLGIKKEGFYKTNITEVIFNDKMILIGDNAFSNCDSLTSIVLPNSLITIGDYAFSTCDKLKSVKFGSGLVTIGDNAFANSGISDLVIIPDSVETIGKCAFDQCYDIGGIVLGSGISSIGVDAFDRSTAWQVYYKGTQDDLSYIIDNEFASVLPKAKIYYYSESCPSGNGAYWRYVDGVPTIWGAEGSACFTYDTFGNSIGVKSIGEHISSSIVIPSIYNNQYVVGICKEAFKYCTTINSLYIPVSIDIIDEDAFKNCSLQTVYYEGTYLDWCTVTFNMSSGNSILETYVQVYCYSETEPTDEDYEDSLAGFWHYCDGVIVEWYHAAK